MKKQTKKKLGLRDDRGNAYTLRGDDVVANLAGKRAGRVDEGGDGGRVIGAFADLLPLAMPLLLLGWFYFFQRQAVYVAMVPAAALFFLAMELRSRLRRRFVSAVDALGPWGGRKISMPTLLAYGRCGGCGYRISDLPVAADERIVCTECGAAWHRGRMTFPDATGEEAAAKITEAAEVGWGGGYFDDRGVWLPPPGPYGWPRGWWVVASPGHAGAVRAIPRLKALRRRRVLKAACVLWIVWAAVIAWVLLGSGLNSQGKFNSSVLLTFVIGLAHLPLVRVWVRSADVRRVLLEEGCCPCCWGEIGAGFGDKPAMDGCIVCGHCRGAWRMEG